MNKPYSDEAADIATRKLFPDLCCEEDLERMNMDKIALRVMNELFQEPTSGASSSNPTPTKTSQYDTVITDGFGG